MTTRGVHVGVDVGSTRTKAVGYDPDGRTLAEAAVVTTWSTAVTGESETTGAVLLAGVVSALHALLARLDDTAPAVRVLSIGVTGMAESGVLLDGAGRELAPVVAWYDPRGHREMSVLPDAVREAFTATTGLCADSQPSAATLAWGRAHGWSVGPDATWLSVPEFVVAGLGGERVAEPSLASRTGLLDITTGRPADDVADALGLPRTLLPALRPAGTSAGTVTRRDLDPRLHGATLTVAGHDHPVAAVGAGATGPDQLFNGSGTADVLLRSVPGGVSTADLARLAAAGISVGRHVLTDLQAVLCGVSAGVILRRVLAAADATDGPRRDLVDRAALAVARPVAGVTVHAGGRGGDDVQIVVAREAGPGELFAAALDHVGDRIAALLALVDDAVGPHSTAVCSGGWSRLASVRARKREVVPRLEFSALELPGCRGAAAFGALAATGATDQRDLPALLAHWADSARPTAAPDPTPRPATPISAPRKRNPMNELTTLERRALARISTADGHLLIVAADQRNGMKAVMTDSPTGADGVTRDDLAAAKSDIVRHLANHGPAILLDPEVALPQIVDDGALDPGTALVVGMDASGFDTVDGLRHTRFVDGVTPRTVRDLGGDAAKMLWYLRPDRQGADSDVVGQIHDLVQACTDEGVLLIVEILTYQLPDESAEQYAERFPSLVIEAARLSAGAGAKVLKLPYPGSAEASAAVTAAADGVPWAVLSAGVDHATFVEQVRTAVANGASGAMAGRALWKDSLSVSAAVREDLLTGRALPRLRELQAAVDQVPVGAGV